MGKVKALWMQEREKRLGELVTKFMSDGFTREEAEEMAEEDMEQEDIDNGQFGMGA